MSEATVTDEKRGWSTMCRRGDFASCATAQAKCANPRHGAGGQTPPQSKAPPAPTSIAERLAAGPKTPGFGKAKTKRRQVEPDLTFEWEEPPPAATTAGRKAIEVRVAPSLEQLRTKPGEWARLISYDSHGGASYAKQKLTKRVGADFEFEARSDTNTSRLWGRYVGEG